MEESLTKSGKADDPVLSVNIASLPRPGGGEMLSGIHFSAGKGECLAVIGPNGSGKTTLLRAIDCQLPSREGDVRLYGRSIAALTRQQRARQIAVLAQNDTPDLRLALEDYVALGRIPHARDMSRREHDIIVTRAINDTGLQRLRKRPLSALSGGERQRAALARVLAQAPKLLLLDEPLSALDLNYQFHVMDLVREETQRRNIITLVVVHDINIALRHADHVLMLKEGQLLGDGAPAEVITPQALAAVYGVRGRIEPCSQGVMQVIIDGLAAGA